MTNSKIRIQLVHGTAVVDRSITPETVEALNKLVICAYNMILNEKNNSILQSNQNPRN